MGTLLAYAAVAAALLLFPAWRIFKRAGLDPWISLVVLIPGIGVTIALAVLAFVDWPPVAEDGGDSSAGSGRKGAF